MNMIELRQKRASLIAQARAILDRAESEKRGLVQEESNQYDALMNDAGQLADTIQRSERLEALEVEQRQASTDANTHRPETDQRGGQPVLPQDRTEYRAAFTRWMRSGDQSPELRALQADSDIYGGYLLAPTQMLDTLIKAMDNLVFVRGWATIFQVRGASDGLGAASLDNDPADPTWTAEIAIGSEDSTMSFGGRELRPHPLAKYIKLSNKLLRKVPSVESLVADRLAYKFAVTQENAYLNGSGANQPLGVFTASSLGIPTSRDVSTGNTITAMTFDGLTEAKFALKQQYWARARWLFHQDGVKQIAKIKDGDGNYIWRESVRAGEPDRLLNVPVFMSQYAPNTFTTGLYVGIIGDWSHYWIADDLNMSMQRLVELYAGTNQTGFIARYEGDGMPVLGEAFARVKLA